MSALTLLLDGAIFALGFILCLIVLYLLCNVLIGAVLFLCFMTTWPFDRLKQRKASREHAAATQAEKERIAVLCDAARDRVAHAQPSQHARI